MQKLVRIVGAVGLIAGGALVTAGLMRVGERPARLSWRDPEIKSALMTFGYKVYANPKVEFGRHYLSKLVFQNTGEHPITNFSISYKIDDFIPWTEPEELSEIPAKFTLVKLFYPKLPAQVTRIRNATQATFHFRVRWREEGKQHEESFARDVLLRGVNEMAYCDLPESELRTQSTVLSWMDVFNASQFAIAMVTPNDPVVNLYTSEITRQAGGSVAGVIGGAKEIGRLCRTIYEYMQATELRYTGDSGVPANFDNVSTMVQTVRMPRDVVINNQGLCVELALLWCSILEHLGVDSAIVFRPGHSYVIAYSISQGIPLSQGLPIECTAITPRAVGREAAVPFDEAVKMAVKDIEKFKDDGRLMILPVKQFQAQGFVAPELADVDTDKLTETLVKRRPAGEQLADVGQRPANVVQLRQQPPVDEMPEGPRLVEGTRVWRHPQGLLAVAIPAGFIPLGQPGNSPPFLLLSVGNPATSVSCDVMQIQGSQEPAQAIGNLGAYLAQLGAVLQVTGSGRTSGGVTRLTGTTTTAAGSIRWVCLARPVSGGVLLVSASAPRAAWSLQATTIEAILSSVQFN